MAEDGSTPYLRTAQVLHLTSVLPVNITFFCVIVLGATGAQASPTWQSYVTDIAPTATTHTVTGLRPAHAYQFQVSAVNAVGKGEASAPSSVIRLPEQRKCHVSVTVLQL